MLNYTSIKTKNRKKETSWKDSDQRPRQDQRNELHSVTSKV